MEGIIYDPVYCKICRSKKMEMDELTAKQRHKEQAMEMTAQKYVFIQ